MVLNVDDIALTNPGKTGYDGLIRNFEGNFQFTLYGSVCLSYISHAETYALMIVYSLHVAHLVSKKVSKLHHYANLFELLAKLGSKF